MVLSPAKTILSNSESYPNFMNLSHLKVNADLISFAPGRINLLGEHTDYNQGYVLPAAIGMGLRAYLKKRTDDQCIVHSSGLKKTFHSRLKTLKRSKEHWENYIIGVINGMMLRSSGLGGFEAYIDGDLPPGSGMSSSAALECCLATGLNELYELELDKRILLEICREADHKFVGVKSGPMDQYASLYGKANHFLLLDCRELSHRYVGSPTGEHRWVVLDSKVSHQLADGAYNKRQEECLQGVEILQREFPLIRSLRDAGREHIQYLNLNAEKTVAKRCAYVILENQRVLRAVQALEEGDVHLLGSLMYETHKGLSEEYEVSCAEIDFLVGRARLSDAVLGARLMGGGFGGCTLNLVHMDGMEAWLTDCRRAYQELYGITLQAYEVAPSEGAHIIS